jgi:hypothetical protein
MVLNTLPRVLSPEDEIVMPVTVFVSDPKIKSVEVNLESTGPVTILGNSKRTISFSKSGQELVYFRFKVLSERGKVKLKTSVKAAGESAYDETELKVRIPNLPETRNQSFVLNPNSDTVINYQPFGLNETNFLNIEASSIPTLNIEKHLHYLSSYPYGCSEQITSSVFPSLFLPKLMELNESQKANRKQNVQIALQKLYERQMANGEIRYWPNSRSHSYNHYVSSYVGHFLIEAQKSGFELPPTMLKRWLSFQKNTARNWIPRYHTGKRIMYNDQEQAYRLLTLAMVNEAEIGAMNRMKELVISPQSLYDLSNAYALIGQLSTAQVLYAKAENLEYESTDYAYFGNELGNASIRLYCLHMLKNKTEAMVQGRKVANLMNSADGYYNTHSLSIAMISLLNVFGDDVKSNTNLDWSLSKGNINKDFHSNYSFLSYELANNRDKAESLILKNNGSKPLFFSLNQQGSSLSTTAEAYNKGVEINLRFLSISGDVIDPARIKQGTDFEMEVRVKKTGSKKAYQDMALKQFIPAGWQILSNSQEAGTTNSYFEYRDIRDDRIFTFFELRNSAERVYKIRLNATYAGRYYLPSFEVEDMYHPEIKARTKARWVEVEP